jgi:hypothetical protein
VVRFIAINYQPPLPLSQTTLQIWEGLSLALFFYGMRGENKTASFYAVAMTLALLPYRALQNYDVTSCALYALRLLLLQLGLEALAVLLGHWELTMRTSGSSAAARFS